MDIDPAKGEGGGGEKVALRFVLAPGPTPASAMYASFLPPDGDLVRISPISALHHDDIIKCSCNCGHNVKGRVVPRGHG